MTEQRINADDFEAVDYLVSEDGDVVAVTRIRGGLTGADRLLLSLNGDLVLMRNKTPVRLDTLPPVLLALVESKGHLLFREVSTENDRIIGAPMRPLP